MTSQHGACLDAELAPGIEAFLVVGKALAIVVLGVEGRLIQITVHERCGHRSSFQHRLTPQAPAGCSSRSLIRCFCPGVGMDGAVRPDGGVGRRAGEFEQFQVLGIIPQFVQQVARHGDGVALVINEFLIAVGVVEAHPALEHQGELHGHHVPVQAVVAAVEVLGLDHVGVEIPAGGIRDDQDRGTRIPPASPSVSYSAPSARLTTNW